MQDVLNKTYYGNTVQEWLIALLFILGAIVVGRILYWIFKTIFRRSTAKTQTNLDDLLVDMVEEPVSFFISILGIRYGLGLLNLPPRVDSLLANGFQFLLFLTAAWLLVRLFDSTYRRYLVPWADKTETELDDQLLPLIRRGTRAIIWIIAVIVGLDNAGYDVAALVAGLGIGGLALAMAARDTVANIFGGFTIFADQPFKLNDRVKISGYDGMVREVGLRSTRLQTLSGTIVTIPNSKFSDSAVENVSLEPSRKMTVSLGLTYDTTPEQMEQAQEILKKIVEAIPDIEENAIIWFHEFGDFAMKINLVYKIRKDGDIVGTLGTVNMRILREFNEAGLEFAFPTQTLYTKQLD